MRQFKFSEILKRLLSEKRISQAALARAIGVSKETISQYAKGGIIPNADRLVKLAEFFGVSPEYLFTGIEPQDAKEQETFNLSSATIRLLRSCKPEILTLIDTLLSDSEFYSVLSDALDKANSYGNNILENFKKNNITFYNTSTPVKDNDRKAIGTPRAIRKHDDNIYEIALANASSVCSQDIEAYISEFLRENTQLKKAYEFFYGKDTEF